MHINLSSEAFTHNAPIPRRYSGEGADVSPPLAWSGVPKAAKELVLICEDPDAPRLEPFTHWVIYGISPKAECLPEGIQSELQLQIPPGAMQGRNSFDRIGYNGPLPPKGHGVHHYHFMLFALNTRIDLPGGLEKSKLLAAVRKHIIDSGELVGTYSPDQ